MNRVFLVLGFVLIMALYSDAQAIKAIGEVEPCCFNFFNGHIPRTHIQEIKPTGSHCPQQGFIVTTSKYPNLCVSEVVVNG
ncbi:C-C motif chemokine 5-like isoform X2 [Tachysurus fulvidraco]|uniref:C-C motif chemokine 5-like isoform X2 n=1 Tax=Tachysurus fulvidraco TaxID=1234273 RepID=UPI001FEF5EA4|nr:C-C motif chemokine 5-like isoform X2 [Tachysurus fulvidraco]